MSATIRSKSLATKKSFTISSAENQSLTLGCTSFEEFWPKLTDPSIPPAKKPKKMFKDCSCVLDAWKSTPNRTITNEWILNDFLKDWDFPTGLIIYHFVLEYFLPKSFCFSLMRGQSISLPLAELDRERVFNTFLTYWSHCSRWRHWTRERAPKRKTHPGCRRGLVSSWRMWQGTHTFVLKNVWCPLLFHCSATRDVSSFATQNSKQAVLGGGTTRLSVKLTCVLFISVWR